jgi:hypothetical protein
VLSVRRAFVLLGFSLCACARIPAPGEPSARALFRDLERQVTVAAAAGWGVDRLEVEDSLPNALDSSCRVDPLARRLLRRWLDDRIAALGGPVEVAYRARGKDLARVDELLVVSRVRLVLIRAEALTADCPFWLEPEQPFRGRQISERRWQLTFGGGGKGIIVHQGGDLDVSFGGAGRALFGRTFGDGHGVYAGLELGGNATFPKDSSGTRTQLAIGADLVAPVMYRYALTNAFFELEAGWIGHATDRDWGAIDHGVHLGGAIGARALRTRFVFPGVAFGMSWERIFVAGGDLTMIKLGARVAFDLDL